MKSRKLSEKDLKLATNREIWPLQIREIKVLRNLYVIM